MFRNMLLAVALSLSVYALASNAQAGRRPTEWYVGLEAGVNIKPDADVLVLPLTPTAIEADFQTGWSAFVDLGYRWESHWRVELEAGYRENEIACVSVGPGPCSTSYSADVSQVTLMANVIHDLPLSGDTTFSIGLGLGADHVQANSPFTEDQDWVLAGQGILELSRQVNDRLEFVLSYRYLRSDDPELRVTTPQNAYFDNENHTIAIGLRFDLQPDAGPEPVSTNAPPPEPPARPEQFIVFFGFNEWSLDAAAGAVVADAAATAKQTGYASIQVTGYTDTAGSGAYNEKLSLRRARAVKQALVDGGIAVGSISAIGKGESVLLVQTSDQEKEARNRRATIDIRREEEALLSPDPELAATPVATGPATTAEAPEPALAAAPSSATPSTSTVAATPASAPRTPPARRRNGVDEETLAQYQVWIAQARARHAYTDTAQRMFNVMMCESGGRASIVNPAGPYQGLFQYSPRTWKGEWNEYRDQSVMDAHAQIFATALAWSRGMQRQWGCYTNPH